MTTGKSCISLRRTALEWSVVMLLLARITDLQYFLGIVDKLLILCLVCVGGCSGITSWPPQSIQVLFKQYTMITSRYAQTRWHWIFMFCSLQQFSADAMSFTLLIICFTLYVNTEHCAVCYCFLLLVMQSLSSLITDCHFTAVSPNNTLWLQFSSIQYFVSDSLLW